MVIEKPETRQHKNQKKTKAFSQRDDGFVTVGSCGRLRWPSRGPRSYLLTQEQRENQRNGKTAA